MVHQREIETNCMEEHKQHKSSDVLCYLTKREASTRKNTGVGNEGRRPVSVGPMSHCVSMYITLQSIIPSPRCFLQYNTSGAGSVESAFSLRAYIKGISRGEAASALEGY